MPGHGLAAKVSRLGDGVIKAVRWQRTRR